MSAEPRELLAERLKIEDRRQQAARASLFEPKPARISSTSASLTISTTIASHTPEEEQRCSDLGNARRMVGLHGNDLRYCYDYRKWFIWDKRRWDEDDSGEAVRKAKQTVRAIFSQAMDGSLPDKQRQTLASWAIRSESDQRISAMLSLAQSEPGIPISAKDLDRDPMLLNCRNGTLDLRTGQLKPHSREHYITRVIDVDYDPAATCPLWEEFLERIMAGVLPLISFLSRAVGYSLTGSIVERVLFILFGEGANGKSVFVETIAALLGDYAARTPTSTLMIKRGDGIPNDIAALKGARLVHASESEQGRRLAESEIKDLTGGDTVSARFMRAEWFTFKPEFKLWLRTNHKPRVVGTDEAIWDRLKLIPFSVRIEKHDQDKALAEKLLTELPGILAWAVRGCLAWQRNGLDIPEEVQTASEQYRLEMDSFGGFVADCCVVGPREWIASKELRDCYEGWSAEKGDRHLLNGTEFRERLTKLGCAAQKKGGRRGWAGIGVEG